MPGAGAFEVACSSHLLEWAKTNVSGKAKLGVQAFADALLVAEIDPDALRRARLQFPALRDEQRELVRRELDRVARLELAR